MRRDIKIAAQKAKEAAEHYGIGYENGYEKGYIAGKRDAINAILQELQSRLGTMKYEGGKNA